MEFRNLHPWDLQPKEAVELQRVLRQQVRVEPLTRPVRRIAGCDISYNKFSDVVYAAIVLLQLPDLAVVDWVGAVTRTSFPYIPGLLSFRETPALLEAWRQLRTAPDAVMLDGHGYAHPRRFGYVCHFGLIVDVPAMGCAKTVLVGKYEEPGPRAGCHTPLVDKEETVGVALRTKDRVAPVFVSTGHRIDLAGAIDLTLRSVKSSAAGRAGPPPSGSPPVLKPRYRIPEPTRLAHILANALRRGESAEAALRKASG